MALNISDIVNRQNRGQAVEKKENRPEFKVQMIHYTKLHESDLNFYSTAEVEKLADILLLSGRVKQNLIVKKIDIGQYEIVAGHKRYLASKLNVERGHKEFEFLPCLEENVEDALSEFDLIVTNSTQRERSDYEKMEEVMKLKELIPRLTGADAQITARVLREVIANELKLSKTKVAQLENINNNLVPEGLEKFKSGDMNVSVANELAGLDEEKQKELLEKDTLTVKDIKHEKQPESSLKTERQEKLENVSDQNEEQLSGQIEIDDFPEYGPNVSVSESDTEEESLLEIKKEESVSDSDTKEVEFSADTDETKEENVHFDKIYELKRMIKQKEDIINQFKEIWMKTRPESLLKQELEIEAYECLLDHLSR